MEDCSPDKLRKCLFSLSPSLFPSTGFIKESFPEELRGVVRVICDFGFDPTRASHMPVFFFRI